MVFRLLSFDYFPPSIDSLFAPLSTAGRSDTETYTRFEPRAAGTTQYVSTNRTHMREARGSMRVRGAPTGASRGRKSNLRWARPHLSWGASKVNR